MKEFKERRYQIRTKESFASWISGDERLATIILPTGVGKTATAAMCLNTLSDQKVLWIAHREELIDQAYEALSSIIPGKQIEIEMADRKANPNAQIVVGSVQTIARNRKHLQDFIPDIIVIDEYHHYSESNIQYDGLLQRFPKAKVLGLTATPWRFSGENLPLGRVLIRMDIGTAVEQGYLVPPVPEALITNISLADVKSRMGDFDIKSLAKAVNVDSRNQLIAQRIIELVRSGRQGILFGVDVAHSKAMYELLKKEVRAAEIYGETPTEERRMLMAKIRNGEIDVLCNNLVCLDDQTEILTKTGWVGMNEITDTHKVANWKDGKIWFEKPKKIIKRDREPNEKMVALETRRRSIRITENHQLIYKKYKQNNWIKDEAKDLCSRHLYLPVSGVAELNKNEENEINIKKPISNLKRRISANSYNLRKIDPSLSLTSSKEEALRRITEHDSLTRKLPHELSLNECKFIGFWIGDGTKVNLQSGGVEYRISQSESNLNVIKMMDNLILKLNYNVCRKEKIIITNKCKEPKQHTLWSFCRGTGFGSQKKEGLFVIEKYLDKNGSDLMWEFSSEQMQAFIEGYWAADGNHKDLSNESCIHIYGVNIKFFDKLQAILTCREYRSSIRKYKNHDGFLYSLSITKTPHHQMTKYCLELEKEWKEEKVWCVSTSSGNIITRRKGSVTVMGNCTEGFDAPHLSFVAIARPTKSLGLYNQMTGRGLRIKDGKKDCIILDICDKIKAKQSRVVFKDMAISGDLYGEKKRANSILLAEIAKEVIHFPIFIKPEKTDRWQIDEETFPIGSWAVNDMIWLASWSAEVKVQKLRSRSIWVPFDSLPDQSIKGKTVKHASFGEGVIKEVLEKGDAPKVLVEFGWGTDRVMQINSLQRVGYVQEHIPDQFDINKIERLFFICLPELAEKGRLISFEKQDYDLIVQEDLRLNKYEMDEYLTKKARSDGSWQLVCSDAKWKKTLASEKQIGYVSGLIENKKIGFDLDVNNLTKGEASSIIEQVRWQKLINKKFGTDFKNKLLGYDNSSEDV